ncbi:hypothetical protein HPB49_004430 [Dermacentor silvarum]|uniref:Uncharacterized protein n=1 Tax=Dermacentor silvarum TaxID=543639 RepID=A0ACB8DU72_DERSI|nr:hypothetical protein HPB49_004430 [Dermacentor silvarum]
MANPEEESPPDPGAASTPPEPEDMDTQSGLATLQARKRPRDQTNSLAMIQDSSGGDEPPPKTPGQTSSVEASSGPTTVDGADNSKPSEEEFPPLSQGTDVKAEPNKNTEDATEDAEADKSACMDVTEAPSSGVAAKRAHEDTNETTANTDGEGQPPTKAAIVRRPTLRPRPNVATGKSVAATPPTAPTYHEAVATEQQEQVEGTVAMPNREEESTPDPGATSTPPEPEGMDTHTGLANLQAGKRPRDQTNSLATETSHRPKRQPADQPLEPQPGIATASERPESSEPSGKEPDATAGQDNMDQSESAAGGLAGKRPWDEGRDETSTPDSGGGGAPPTKAAGNRRPSFKPRPTIPASPRAEAKPPLQSTPPG